MRWEENVSETRPSHLNDFCVLNFDPLFDLNLDLLTDLNFDLLSEFLPPSQICFSSTPSSELLGEANKYYITRTNTASYSLTQPHTQPLTRLLTQPTTVLTFFNEG